MQFYIVDVFAQIKYAGNPLGVVLGAGSLSSQAMQAIAREMNYSETTFVLTEADSNPQDFLEQGYPVRIFTPVQELPFAGHPTLGTAYVIWHHWLRRPVETIRLELSVGSIPVTLHYQDGAVKTLWMRQPAPQLSQSFAPDILAKVLNLENAQIDPRFPSQEVSTGVPFIIVPLTSLAALQKVWIERDRYFELIKSTAAQAILVFCPETRHPQAQLSVRVFAEALGIPEDPATGSASGCLAAYLSYHRYFGTQAVDVLVEQGYEVGRPSQLYLRANRQLQGIEVSVGGQVIPVAQGQLL